MVESSSQFRTFACYEVIRFFIISPNSPIEKLNSFTEETKARGLTPSRIWPRALDTVTTKQVRCDSLLMFRRSKAANGHKKISAFRCER